MASDVLGPHISQPQEPLPNPFSFSLKPLTHPTHPTQAQETEASPPLS